MRNAVVVCAVSLAAGGGRARIRRTTGRCKYSTAVPFSFIILCLLETPFHALALSGLDFQVFHHAQVFETYATQYRRIANEKQQRGFRHIKELERVQYVCSQHE